MKVTGPRLPGTTQFYLAACPASDSCPGQLDRTARLHILSEQDAFLIQLGHSHHVLIIADGVRGKLSLQAFKLPLHCRHAWPDLLCPCCLLLALGWLALRRLRLPPPTRAL